MSKFYIKPRFDSTVANEGVWFPIYDTADEWHGDFKLKLLDSTTREGERTYKRIRQNHMAEIRTKKLTPYESLMIVLVEGSLLDWKLPNDPELEAAAIAEARGKAEEKGKPFSKQDEEAVADKLRVPFTRQNALEYFGYEETKWVAYKLSELAGDAANFRGELFSFDSADEIAGN